MIKQCKVLFYNQFSNVLAFKFSDLDVQITINEKLDSKVRTVNVKFEDNCYSLTDEEETKEIKISKKYDINKSKEQHVSTVDVENA